jgi:hypothetical protein
MPDNRPIHRAVLRVEELAPNGHTHLSMLIGCDTAFDHRACEWVATNSEGYRGTGERVAEAVLDCLRNHALGRAPLSPDTAMSIVKRCKLCDTIEAFEVAGKHMVFAPHRDDPSFCRDMAIGKMHTFERVIKELNEEMARLQLAIARMREALADTSDEHARDDSLRKLLGGVAERLAEAPELAAATARAQTEHAVAGFEIGTLAATCRSEAYALRSLLETHLGGGS